MKLVHAERHGEAFDSQLVIGVRESYGNNNIISKSCDVKKKDRQRNLFILKFQNNNVEANNKFTWLYVVNVLCDLFKIKSIPLIDFLPSAPFLF